MAAIFQDIFTLLTYVGLDVIGAAGIIGAWIAHEAHVKRSEGWLSLTRSVLSPILLGFLLALVGWFLAIMFHPELSFAQESLNYVLSNELEILLLKVHLISVASLAFVILIGGVGVFMSEQAKPYQYKLFYSILFLIAVAARMAPAVILADRLGAYIALASLAQMFTIGTLVVLAFIYFKARVSGDMRKTLYPFFESVTNLFWVGLVLSFVSVLPVFEQLEFSDVTFTFSQVMLGIACVSFALLSGPIRQRITLGLRKKSAQVSFAGSVFISILVAICTSSLLMVSALDALELPLYRTESLVWVYLVLLITTGAVVCCIERYFKKRGYEV